MPTPRKVGSAGTEHDAVDANNKLLWVNRGTNAAPTPGQANSYRLYTHDACGRVSRLEEGFGGTGSRTHNHHWDADDRLGRIWALAGDALMTIFEAKYAADGLRVWKSEAWSGAHDYSWGPGGIVHDSSGTTTLTAGFAQRRGGVDTVFHSDWLGSTRYMTDPNGVATSGTRFDAFGQRMARFGPSHPTDYQWGGAWGVQREPGSTDVGFDFAGQYYDPATGRPTAPYASWLAFVSSMGRTHPLARRGGAMTPGRYWNDVGIFFWGEVKGLGKFAFGMAMMAGPFGPWMSAQTASALYSGELKWYQMLPFYGVYHAFAEADSLDEAGQSFGGELPALGALGAGGACLAGRGLSGLTRGGSVTLYRAVGPAESADILSSGVFRPGPMSLPGKWFARTPQGAAMWVDGSTARPADRLTSTQRVYREGNTGN